MHALLFILLLSLTRVSGLPEFCLNDSKGYVTALASPCPPGTSAFRGVGVNLFDIFWGAWGTGGPNATLATAKAAIRDAAMSGFTFARTFASPWSYSGWGWFNQTTRPAYWQAAGEVIAEAERSGIKLIPSLSYGCADTTLGCNPAETLFGETYREFITNSSSLTRTTMRAYHQDFVAHFKASPAILFWELGNEHNLQFDGCTYDKSPGAFFTTAEGLSYQRDARADIKAVDPERPVNSGMSSPRARAKHIMNTPGGAANCVTPENPHGDCELCFNIPADTQGDYVEVLKLYYAEQDIVSAHYYGCAAPYGNLSWCSDPASTAPLAVLQATAEALQKPLYVGEFGPHDGNWSSTADGGTSPGRSILVGMASANIQLSSLWAWECPSHDHTDQPGFCLHPGYPAAQPFTWEVEELSQSVNRQLQEPPLPSPQSNLTLVWLPPPTGAPGEPACLDGSQYGYYALPGSVNKWLVMLQGGGWCYSMEDCFSRTQPSYAGGNLGSSKYWSDWSWKFDLGVSFDDWGVLFFPYCDGASYSGAVDLPVPYNSTLNLYFRGAANLFSALSHAQAKFNITAPTEVVVIGGSAGGLSTTLHVDAIGEALGAGSVVGVPECGWFPFWDAPCAGPTNHQGQCNTTGDFYSVVTLQNATGVLSPECKAAAAAGAGDVWKCFMAQVATPFVHAPLFLWQSKFDHFQLSSFLGVDCSFEQAYNPPWNPPPVCSTNETAAILAYGEYFMGTIQDLIAAPGPHRALYLTSCILHGMDYNLLSVGDVGTPGGEGGITPSVAFNTWYRAVRDGVDNAPSVDNNFKWVEDLVVPRVNNILACPPFVFTPAVPGTQ